MEPAPGEYTATRPLQIVQIDHAQIDVIVVDDQSRERIGQPWITLAVDVLTRMVVGLLSQPRRTVTPTVANPKTLPKNLTERRFRDPLRAD